MLNVFKTFLIKKRSTVRLHLSSYGWRALEKLENMRITLFITLLSCSPNFPRASITL